MQSEEDWQDWLSQVGLITMHEEMLILTVSKHFRQPDTHITSKINLM